MTKEDEGVVVPDHKILGVLGQGGMARVYLARDEAFDRLVAVKVIDARFAFDDQFQRRFEREAKTAGGLSHPNIVPVHRYGLTTDGRPFLTMAYLEGGSLRDRMRKRGAMSVEEALGIARQIAGALLAAHSRSIVHRDLKPDNVLFQGETAYLTDFGIAKLLNAATELTSTGLNPGTVRYFSPEQAQEHAVDARSDIYALGILTYEMLTGRMPIEGDTMVQMIMRIVYSPPQPLPDHLRGLQPFMDVLLAKDPADRLGSCQDVISIVDAMLRNWMRYADINRLTDGVVMLPSRQASPSIDMDDEAPAGHPPAGTDPFDAAQQITQVRAHGAPAPAASGVMPLAAGSGIPLPEDDITGLTDLDAKPRPAPIAAAEAPAPTIASGGSEADAPAAAAGAPRHDDVTRVEQPTGAAAAAEEPAGAVDAAVDANEPIEAHREPAAPPRADAAAAPAAPADRRRLPIAASGLAALVLVALAAWWLRGPTAEHATATRPAPAADPAALPAAPAPEAAAPAVAAGPASAPAAAPATATAAAPATAAPAVAADAPAAAPGLATLRVAVTPKDARITLPELRQRFGNGMQLPVGDVLVRIERRGYAPIEERLHLQAGANSFDRVLQPAPDAAAQVASSPSPAAVAPPPAPASAKLPPRTGPIVIRRPGEVFRDRLALGADGPAMVVVPAGSFRMGGSGRDEGPMRNVNIRRPFAAGVYEVTFDDFDRFTQAQGRPPVADQGWGRGRRPAINVSWNDAKDYVAWLSAQTGQRYRLLSEAEWEYANRAGSTTAYWFGDGIAPGRANCDGCGGAPARQTTNVGAFAPNAFGLYDTLGNVWEWVEDCYAASYADAPADGRARGGNCRERVFRGGSWYFDAASMRSAKRSVFGAGARSRDLGFRVARDL